MDLTLATLPGSTTPLPSERIGKVVASSPR
jgi:hypothetical protein